MPSKIKKQSKMPTHSKLSYSDQSPSPRTPASSSIPLPNTEVSEGAVMDALKEASRKYPSLISTSAFIGQVTNVDTVSKGCKIWLSESSMVSSSLVPGSIVSVSLASLMKDFSNSFPLSSLAEECARNIGIDSGDIMADQAGNFFALATVFPSCKVLKNGVRLSSSLSYTMGCPGAGRFMFVNPIQSQQLAGNGIGNDKPHSVAVNRLPLYGCKELYLELAPSRNGVTMKSNMSASMRFSDETSDDRHRNQISSSPKTPLYQSTLSSSNTGQLTSSLSEKSVSSLLNSKKTSFDLDHIRQVLGDESSKKLLQTCATSWLSYRSLLYGNLVTIPILSEICIFQVIGANRLPAEDSNQDWTGEKSNGLFPRAVKLVDDAFVVDSETKVYLSLPLNLALEAPHGRSLPLLDFEYEDVKAKVGHDILKLGGLSKEYAILKDIIISSSVKDTLASLGLRTTKGVLLHGPPGTGKTTLARLCARDAGVNVFSVNGPEIVSQYYGESEKSLHEVFDSASQAAPSVVFIDELDAIAPARKDGGEELSQRLVATLLNLMDGICRTDGLLVIAATNRPDSIEPALRRPGRLDREIEIGVPSPKQRLDILITLLSEMEHSLSDAQVHQLAMSTHGFVGADLAALCNEAAYVCLRHRVMLKKCRDDFPSMSKPIMNEDCSDVIKGGYDRSKDTNVLLSRNHSDSAASSKSDLHISSEILPSSSLTGTVQESTGNIQSGLCHNFREMCVLGEDRMLTVTIDDFEKARIKVKPSAMREVILEVPKVNWEDVGGQKEVKAQLMEAVEWPQKYHAAFKRIGTSPPTGVLLFGPPGCSKTLMARAVASEAGLNFLAVKGPELFSKWVGESEKAVRSLFAKARANAPSIIFFDEIDGLAVIRGRESDGISVADRVMSQLLVELDGLHQRVNVTVIAATNRPDKIDPALLRPGRFDRLLYVGPPNESDREDIFRIHLRKIPCSSDVNLKELASHTEGCTGADISLICREAAVAALEESLDVSEIRMEHLKTAIKIVQPSEIPSYQELSATFQRIVYSSATREKSKSQPCSSRLSWIPFW